MQFFTKAFIAYCFLVFAFVPRVQATHYRAGEISYKLLNAQLLHYEASVITYSKISGTSALADRDSVEIFWGDGHSSVLKRVNGADTDSNGIADGELCEIDIKKNVYTGTHQYAGLPLGGYYIISFFDPNRIDGINNIDAGNSVNVPFYIQDTLFIQHQVTAAVNNSPVFLACPVEYALAGDVFAFNSTAFDADGDSLYFELVIPLQDAATNVPLYQYPHQYCGGNNIFYINNQTGQFTWNAPCQQGIFNIALRVKEYRCGVLLGTVMRDMQIIVANNANRAPELTTTAIDTFIQPGEVIQFAVSAQDTSVQSVTLNVLGGAFNSSASQPVFVSAAGNPATGTFTWQPDVSYVQRGAHLFSVVAEDNFQVQGSTGLVPFNAANWFSFRIWVTDTTQCLIAEIDEVNHNLHVMTVYPNPAYNFVTAKADAVIKEAALFDISGKLLMNLYPGTTEFKIWVNELNAGIYYVMLKTELSTAFERFLKTD